MKVTNDNNVITVKFEDSDIVKISEWIGYHKRAINYGSPEAKKIYEAKRDFILGQGEGDKAFNIIFDELLYKNGENKGLFMMKVIFFAAMGDNANALRRRFNVDTITKEDRKGFIHDLLKKAIEDSETIDKDFYDKVKARGYELKFEI